MSHQIHCTLCDFVASEQQKLNEHAFSKHFQCVICGKVCTSALDLITHKKSMHHKNRTKDPSNSCKYCSYKTEIKSDWQFHVAMKHDICWICDEKQSNSDLLFNHLEDIHQHDVLKCKRCEFRTLDSDSLTFHKDSHKHDPKTPKKSELTKKQKRDADNNNKEDFIDKENVDPYIYECRKCDFKTRKERKIKNHFCEDIVNVETPSRTARKSVTKAAMIEVTDTKQKNEDDDEIPSFSDEEDTPFPSSIPHKKAPKINFEDLIKASDAGKALARKSKQLFDYDTSYESPENKKKRRRKEQDFICEKCEFTTQGSRDFSRHIRQEHIFTNEKSYKCDMCHFSTFNKHFLNYHIEENKCFSEGDAIEETSSLQNDSQKSLNCDICHAFKCVSPLDFIDHIKKNHVRQSKIPKMMTSTPQPQKFQKKDGRKIRRGSGSY